jgi:tRNA A37 methylthiotransferase MiaB
MRYEGPIYLPPSEAQSLLIQATVGRPHNQCTFCMVYKKGRFRLLSPHQVLRETRLFLESVVCQTVLTSDHYTHYVNLSGSLPQDKGRLLAEIDQALGRDESAFRPFFIGTA